MWYMLLINLLATPGFALTLCMGRFGRRTFQLSGFLGMALCFFLVGATFGTAPQVLLVVIFGLQKIFDSAGPGATTIIIPGEIFPTAVRATCHGASSAAGKLGAFVGMYCFPFVQSAIGFQGVLLLGGALLVAGALLTLALTPPYGEETLRRLAVETQSDIGKTTAVLWGKEMLASSSDACSSSQAAGGAQGV